MMDNVQSDVPIDRIPHSKSFLQGSWQSRILADPNTLGRIYVIVNNRPDATDYADVYIVVSTDNGGIWSVLVRIDSGFLGIFYVMFFVVIDFFIGFIVVIYYDNRNGRINSSGDFLFDVFATTNADNGTTFTPNFQINTTSFDPD